MPPPAFGYEERNMMLVVGAPYKARLFSIGKGAIGSYSVSPDLPSGLALDTSTGVIVGTPEAAQKRTDYVVRARNAFGVTAAKASIEYLVHVRCPHAHMPTCSHAHVPTRAHTCSHAHAMHMHMHMLTCSREVLEVLEGLTHSQP